jgi:hypothetical protein
MLLDDLPAASSATTWAIRGEGHFPPTGRYELGGVVFERWEIEELEDLP